jgi:hypothetical protein
MRSDAQNEIARGIDFHAVSAVKTNAMEPAEAPGAIGKWYSRRC